MLLMRPVSEDHASVLGVVIDVFRRRWRAEDAYRKAKRLYTREHGRH